MSGENPLGERVRLLRGRLSMTQEDLAARAGVTAKTIARIEAGRAKPHEATLRAIAQTLGVATDDLKVRMK